MQLCRAQVINCYKLVASPGQLAVSKELSSVGFDAESELRKAIKESPSAEVRIRARLAHREILSKPRAELSGHAAEVYSVAFSPNGKLLARESKDGTERIWEVKSRPEVAKLLIEVGVQDIESVRL